MIQPEAFQTEDPETGSDHDAPSFAFQDLLKLLKRDPVHLHIDILVLFSPDPVPYETADKEAPASLPGDLFRDSQGLFHILSRHIPAQPSA